MKNQTLQPLRPFSVLRKDRGTLDLPPTYREIIVTVHGVSSNQILVKSNSCLKGTVAFCIPIVVQSSQYPS